MRGADNWHHDSFYNDHMAITDPNTVLILGAGVSAPFGMPLGGPLIGQIASQIKSERTRIYEGGWTPDIRSNLIYAARDSEAFMQAPIHGAFVRKHMNMSNPSEVHWHSVDEEAGKLERLCALLSNQTSETIDDFIVENPSYAEPAKIGIASLLLKKTYQFNADGRQPHWTPTSFETRHSGPKNERNWVHLLINIIRHGIRNGDVTPENKIKIVTFNYDRILEYVLEAQFSNTEATHPHYSNFVDILHVHGCFDELKKDNLQFADIVLKWAGGIHVVNDPSVPQKIADVRLRAREIIENAKEVYAVGFSFAGPNCKRIGLDEWGKTARNEQGRKGEARRVQKYLGFCNYEGSVGVKRSVERVCRLASEDLLVEEAFGTMERPLGVSDWLKSGHLGELPG